MVPFYGQGMNAGLEDVRILFDHFRGHLSPVNANALGSDEERAKVLQEYTAQRSPDAHVINDLALSNYIEMRSSVRSPLYRLRKWIEERVDIWFPQLGWRTQYSRISFGNERYSEVQKAVRKQGAILGNFIWVLAIITLAGGARGAWWIWRTRATPARRLIKGLHHIGGELLLGTKARLR